MAISAAIEVASFGVSANYHRITQVLTSYVPDPMVPGSVGVLYATLVGYATQEARDAGRGGIDKGEFQIRFGADVSEYLNDAKPASTYEDVVRDDDGHIVMDADGKAVMEVKPIPARAATPIPVIRSDEPTRAEIYAAIMALPQFADAEQV